MSYHGWQPEKERLIRLDQHGLLPDPAVVLAHDGFRAVALSRGFACVAGAAAVRAGNYRFGSYSSLGDPSGISQLAHDLRSFIAEFPLNPDRFASYVASFQEPTGISPVDFENLLWQTLQGLNGLDTQPWDPTVSSDPDEASFSFSFHGRSFFVIGMHSASPRWTRRLASPTLVFNAHAQFEELRRAGKFTQMQRIIRNRDTRLQGGFNPGLQDYGNQSEAKQYGGRVVEPTWQCPFHAKSH
jgi:FPC/CPF motif-containing protein YcgG